MSNFSSLGLVNLNRFDDFGSMLLTSSTDGKLYVCSAMPTDDFKVHTCVGKAQQLKVLHSYQFRLQFVLSYIEIHFPSSSIWKGTLPANGT